MSLAEKAPVYESTQPTADNSSLSQSPSAANASEHIIVVGCGPVGCMFVNTYLQINPSAKLTLFGDEGVLPYNRVQLTALLAGKTTLEQIQIPLPDAAQYTNFDFISSKITDINSTKKVVIDENNSAYQYSKLVLATGANAHLPSIPGNQLSGVYTFRSLIDTEKLYARIARSRHIIIVGGGLLGLEAAHALKKHQTKITVIQQGPHVMNRQLDSKAGKYLQSKLEKSGIEFITNSGVREVLGDERVEGVVTSLKEKIPCDTVLMCAGIRPNIALAYKAKIKVRNGFVVNDQLQTSNPDIYAIGECSEHRGLTYGLVNPGFEQARVAANAISSPSAHYKGSLLVSKLKVVGEPVCSIGDIEYRSKQPFQSLVKYDSRRQDAYRKIIFMKGRIVGAVGLGDWPESIRIQESLQENRYIWPWQRLTFLLTGSLWMSPQSASITSWPSDSVICQCKTVTKGKLQQCIQSGCDSQLKVQHATGAGTVCGSCVPLLNELIADETNKSPIITKEFAWKSLLSISFLAALLAIVISSIPAQQTADSVQMIGWFEKIWNDKFNKQFTGFTLLTLTALSLVMSLRKRLDIKWMGSVAFWRLTHTTMGLLCAVILVFHSGFHLGENLNRLLIINFIAILVIGASTGIVVALSHKLSAQNAKRLRKTWGLLHIIVSWPLPALLIAHIASVYYF